MNVQIPEELFLDLVRFHWMDDKSPELVARIKDGLEVKVKAMAKRQQYRETLLGKDTAP